MGDWPSVPRAVTPSWPQTHQFHTLFSPGKTETLVHAKTRNQPSPGPCLWPPPSNLDVRPTVRPKPHQANLSRLPASDQYKLRYKLSTNFMKQRQPEKVM